MKSIQVILTRGTLSSTQPEPLTKSPELSLSKTVTVRLLISAPETKAWRKICLVIMSTLLLVGKRHMTVLQPLELI